MGWLESMVHVAASAGAVNDLGRPEEIGMIFAGFQKYLYELYPGLPAWV